MLIRLSLRLRVFLIFAGLAAGALALLGAGLWTGFHQLNNPALLDAFVRGENIFFGWNVLKHGLI